MMPENVDKIDVFLDLGRALFYKNLAGREALEAPPDPDRLDLKRRPARL